MEIALNLSILLYYFSNNNNKNAYLNLFFFFFNYSDNEMFYKLHFKIKTDHF